MDPLLQNAPPECKNPKWREDTWVSAPYGNVDNNSRVVKSMIEGYVDLTNTLGEDPPPQDGIGYNTTEEQEWRKGLENRAKALQYVKTLDTTQKDVRTLASRATTLLRFEIPNVYLKGPPFDNPTIPGEIIANQEWRKDISDMYADAIELLWCAEYIYAKGEVYLENKAEAEAKAPKKGPGGPTLTTTPPPTFKLATAKLGPAAAPIRATSSSDIDEAEGTTPTQTGPDPQTEDEPKPQKKGNSGLMVAGLMAGVALVGFVALSRS